MVFEFDPVKSAKNKKKHGLDFKEAQAIWDGPVIEFPVLTTDEPRWLVIGKIQDLHWSAIITRRKENSIRIISVRRSRKEEKKLYEG